MDFADRSESGLATLEKVRSELQGIPGVEIDIDQDSHGPPTGPPVNIEIAGPEYVEAARIADEIKRMLVVASESGQIAGLVDVSDSLQLGRPEIHVDIDRERAAQFGGVHPVRLRRRRYVAPDPYRYLLQLRCNGGGR